MFEYRTTASNNQGKWIITPILVDEQYFDILHLSEGTPTYQQVIQEGIAKGLITIIGDD